MRHKDVYILGRPVLDPKKVRILAKESFDIPSMPQFESCKRELREIELKYDDTGSAQYGDKYIGYAVFLLHGENVIYFMCTPSHLKKKLSSKLLDAQQGDTLKP